MAVGLLGVVVSGLVYVERGVQTAERKAAGAHFSELPLDFDTARSLVIDEPQTVDLGFDERALFRIESPSGFCEVTAKAAKSEDPVIYLYERNEEGHPKAVGSNDDADSSVNARLMYLFESPKTYLVEVRNIGAAGRVTVNIAAW